MSNREPTLYIHFYSNKKGNPEVRSIEFLMANRKKKKLSLEKSRMVSLEESEDSTYRYEYTVAFYPAGDTIWWYVGEKLAQLPENQRKNRETDVVEFVQDLLKLTEISIVDIDTDEKYMDEKHKFHLEQAEPIIYSHGSYFGCGELLGTFGYSVKKR